MHMIAYCIYNKSGENVQIYIIFGLGTQCNNNNNNNKIKKIKIIIII